MCGPGIHPMGIFYFFVALSSKQWPSWRRIKTAVVKEWYHGLRRNYLVCSKDFSTFLFTILILFKRAPCCVISKALDVQSIVEMCYYPRQGTQHMCTSLRKEGLQTWKALLSIMPLWSKYRIIFYSKAHGQRFFHSDWVHLSLFFL